MNELELFNLATIGNILWWLSKRICQWSTIRGIIGLVTAIWIYQLHPNTVEAIMASGLGLISLVNIIRDENKKDKEL